MMVDIADHKYLVLRTYVKIDLFLLILYIKKQLFKDDFKCEINFWGI